MPVSVNTQKALGGNNPIKLSGNAGGDANNSIAGWFEAPQQNTPVPFSSFYRKTNVDLTRNDFDFNQNDVFVPDATENATVATSGPISFSDFRGQNDQGVIKEYVITQTGNDVNLTLNNANWNSNLGKNVPKVANINGRMTSGSAPSGQSHAGYNHQTGAALSFDAETYNLIIDVDTETGDTNNFNNATGVFGFGGQGGTKTQTNGNAGGTAMYVRQGSNRAGASAIIRVDTNSGRLFGGGGGGEGGRDGNNGNTAQCRFISKPNTLHRIHNGWHSTIRNSSSGCYSKNKGCPSPSSIVKHGIAASNRVYRLDQFNPRKLDKNGAIKEQGPQSACNPAHGGRSRCRGNRYRGNSSNMGCFKGLDKRCAFQHNFSGNTGTKGFGGGGGQGKGGTGPAGSGASATAGTCPSCNDPTGGSKAIITISSGTCGNSGTSGQSGGGFGQAGGSNSSRTGSGGAAGYAMFTPTKSQVFLTNLSNNKGLT